MKQKIVIVGSGYVGMSLAVLMAQRNNVTVLEIDEDRIQKINNKISTIKDIEIDFYLKNKQLSITATSNKNDAYINADFVVVATPTNYDEKINNFDTSSVDAVVQDALKFNEDALIVIKSTIPLGHTEFLNKKNKTSQIIFSPEFLREGSALKDNLYPSRIVIGGDSPQCKLFANLLLEASNNKNTNMLFISSSEAEAVKLFSNSYLAMRVAFFNELDNYALKNNLCTKNIIESICLDSRIGTGYNNPSFGYGGYCLPKDTKQLEASYKDVPQRLVSAIVESNLVRKDFITNEILKLNPKSVGIYRLIMKEGSDNFRYSSIQDIMKNLKDAGVDINIYEPILLEREYNSFRVESDLNIFKDLSDVIIANRSDDLLKDVEKKVFTRDIFNNN